jgi:hypothetical protein
MDLVKEIKDNLPIDIIRYIIEPYLKIDDLYDCHICVVFEKNHNLEYKRNEVFENILNPIFKVNKTIEYRESGRIYEIQTNQFSNKSSLFTGGGNVYKRGRMRSKGECKYECNIFNLGYYEMYYLRNYRRLNYDRGHIGVEVSANVRHQGGKYFFNKERLEPYRNKYLD